MCNNVVTYTVGATALTRGQAVRLDTGVLVAATTAAHVPIGIVLEDTAIGGACPVACPGSAQVEAQLDGTPPAVGAYVTATTGGKLVTVTPGAANGWVWGLITAGGTGATLGRLAFCPFYATTAGA
jgi:hypothetical protein